MFSIPVLSNRVVFALLQEPDLIHLMVSYDIQL